MVRKYKRKRPRQWRDKNKRMTHAVRLRAEGKSLREIGAELAVSHQTVSNDLARWDAQQQEATPANVVLLSKKASKTGVKSGPTGGEIRHPDLTAVASLNDRRK